jgi:hypothetical protein
MAKWLWWLIRMMWKVDLLTRIIIECDNVSCNKGINSPLIIHYETLISFPHHRWITIDIHILRYNTA